MKRLLRLLSGLALLALAAAPHGRAWAAPGALSARALVDSVAASYGRMARFHFAGVTRSSMSGGKLPGPISIEVGFVYGARFPSRLHAAMNGAGMSSLFVADGESLYVAAPELKQFLVQKAPRLVPGQMPDDETASALQPLLALGMLEQRLQGATDEGLDTVVTTAGPVTCRKLLLSYLPDSSGRGPTMLPRMLWVDESRRLVLRDSLTIEFDAQGAGRVRRTQEMRFAHADDAGGGPDSLYRFRPPAGSARVQRFGNAAPPPRSELAGKPAKDFTLPALAGPAVTLSKLKGKVVVLDFWATWCGPCRRWMPIVAKLEAELKGRDVRFYAVNLSEPPEKVRSFLQQTKTSVPVLMDRDGKVGGAYGASSIPLTVVVGRDGKVTGTLLGLHPEEDLRAALREAGVKGV